MEMGSARYACLSSLSFVPHVDSSLEWNRDPKKDLKKKIKDSKLKGKSALHNVPVVDGQQSNRPNAPPVRSQYPVFRPAVLNATLLCRRSIRYHLRS